MTVLADIPLRLGRGQNDRIGWPERARRVKSERESIGWALIGKPKPSLPCAVLITRVAPGNGLDDDNIVGACKAVRDAFAKWVGVDDKRADIVRYTYVQERAPWGVRIEVVA